MHKQQQRRRQPNQAKKWRCTTTAIQLCPPVCDDHRVPFEAPVELHELVKDDTNKEVEEEEGADADKGDKVERGSGDVIALWTSVFIRGVCGSKHDSRPAFARRRNEQQQHRLFP